MLLKQQIVSFLIVLCLFSSGLTAEKDTGLPLEIKLGAQGIANINGKEAEYVGTKGQGRPIQSLTVSFKSPVEGVEIEAYAHVSDVGDVAWRNSAKGVNESQKQIEGVAFRLVGPKARRYIILYQVHMGTLGDSEIYADGEFCGTRGQHRAIEGLVIQVREK